MKILCDIGNTSTTILFISKNLTKLKKVCTKKFLESIKSYKNEEFYLSCVVNEIEKKIRKNFKNVKFIYYKDLLKYMEIKYNLKNIGSDRLLNAFFVKEIFGNKSCIISLGTAIVVDYIDKNCKYVGGEIFPGIRILAKGLYDYTSKLPFINANNLDVKIPNSFLNLVGNNTKDCIIKGIINFCFSGIKNFVEVLKPKNLIITGGDGEIFFNILKFDDINVVFIKNLVILGIVLWCYYEKILTQEEFDDVVKKIL
ncbi:MAG: type III pantothenate kinase [Endomicrobiia bacterium]